jgi:hypothetical protein
MGCELRAGWMGAVLVSFRANSATELGLIIMRVGAVGVGAKNRRNKPAPKKTARKTAPQLPIESGTAIDGAAIDGAAQGKVPAR